MFRIINKDGGVWGECETQKEAEEVCAIKGYSFQRDEDDTEDVEDVLQEAPQEKVKRKYTKRNK